MIYYKNQKVHKENIEEANQLVVDLGFAKTADFTGLKPEDVNKIIQALDNYFREYSLLKPIGFVGNGLIHNPDFITNDPTVFAWVEAVECKGAAISAEALCFVHSNGIDMDFLLAHEMCHVMDSNLGMSISSRLDYRDTSEFLADKWAEYKTFQNPSKTAVFVGRYIESRYKNKG